MMGKVSGVCGNFDGVAENPRSLNTTVTDYENLFYACETTGYNRGDREVNPDLCTQTYAQLQCEGYSPEQGYWDGMIYKRDDVVLSDEAVDTIHVSDHHPRLFRRNSSGTALASCQSAAANNSELIAFSQVLAEHEQTRPYATQLESDIQAIIQACASDYGSLGSEVIQGIR